MFIRRIGDRAILDYAFDFAVVVLGVFLGLQAQGWAEHRADRAQEARFLSRLASDFDAISQEAEHCVGVYRRAGDSARRVAESLAAMRSGDAAPPPAFRADLIALTETTFAPGRSVAFIEMLSSGELDLIRSETLRTALVQYDQRSTENRESWRAIFNMNAPLFPHLYGSVELAAGDSAGELSVTNFDAQGMARDDNIAVLLNMVQASAANMELLCSFQLDDARRVQTLLADQ